MTKPTSRLASFINDNIKGARVTTVAVAALLIAGVTGFSSLDAHLNGVESPVVTVAQAIASPFQASDASELISVSDVTPTTPHVVTVSGSAGIVLPDTPATYVITVSGSAGINL
jgi:hypothetical protein